MTANQIDYKCELYAKMDNMNDNQKRSQKCKAMKNSTKYDSKE